MKIKFVTSNIWFGGKIWDNLIEFIASEKPDILAIQEVYDGHGESLEKRFKTMEEFEKIFSSALPYFAFGPTLIDEGVNVPWGNAVFSKFPIESSKTIFFDLPFSKYNFSTDPDPRLAAEGMLEAEIDINGYKTFVYSWHGVWNNHGGDTPQRKIMEEKIIENLTGKNTFILAGDTNMNPDSGVIKRLQEKLPMASVFGESLKTTFNLKRKNIVGNYDKSPVDMVFVSKNIKVLDHKMPTVDISDHFPLVCEFEI